MQTVELDRDVCYRALRTRDARFDGRFYTAVVSTGIYCRPICPARTAKIENCLFLPSAGAAHEMGFRPCLRCRPELAPGIAGWRGTANTVSRALGLIAEGGWSDGGADELASRLGVGTRHLRRLFDRYVGASPISVAQAHRILFAKKLIGETSLSMTEIALAAGFGSVRRFNDVFQATYDRAPSTLRKRVRGETPAGPSITLRLPFSPPYDWRTMVGFLAARAIPNVELVTCDRYCRTFELGTARGTLEVRPIKNDNALAAIIVTSDVRALGAVVMRVRRLFDLDADAIAIDEHLSHDDKLRALVRDRPGVRVPGAWDVFELAVRAVLGQQVSVRAATTFAGRLASSFGDTLDCASGAREDAPKRLFPAASAIGRADLSRVGLTRARSTTLKAIALRAHLLQPHETLVETVDALAALPGVGEWTAQYIAMRALRQPDAFPASDLGLLRAMSVRAQRPTVAALTHRAESWRPWRSYAAMRLWTQCDLAKT